MGYEVPRSLFFLPAERKKESEKDLSKKIKTKPVRRAPLVEQESECGKEEKGFTRYNRVLGTDTQMCERMVLDRRKLFAMRIFLMPRPRGFLFNEERLSHERQSLAEETECRELSLFVLLYQILLFSSIQHFSYAIPLYLFINARIFD